MRFVLKAMRSALVLACLLTTGSGAGAQEQAGSSPGEWKAREFTFQLMEFTSRYTCDGLHQKLEIVLQQLGAKPGAELMETGCMEPGYKGTRVPSATMRFATLVPAQGAGTQQGAWKSVNLVGNEKFENTECELLEEVVRSLVPLFTVRNVQPMPPCFPHTQTIVSSMKLEVFAPVAPK
jgi:hypothetical protein